MAGLFLVFGVTATACDDGSPFGALGSMTCRGFHATFHQEDGYLNASFLDCLSGEGTVQIMVIVTPGCQAQCLVYRSLGIDMEPQWGTETSCTELPPRSSDAETVAAFINDVCGWHVASWDAGLVTDQF